jgi:hypothetical protein
MDIDLPLVSSRSGEPLCFRCEMISVDTVFLDTSFGIYHSNRLEEIIESASDCALCALICDGLLANIADKMGDEPNITHDHIVIRPDVDCISGARTRKLYQAGLRVRSLSSHISCMLNWYLPRNGLSESTLS